MADQREPNPHLLPPVSSLAGLPGILLQQGLLSAPLQPGQAASLEHYHILSELGQGGMGIVLRGMDPQSGATVAIKLLRPELATHPQLVHRFLKEARHMQRLKHPNILPVLHVSEGAATPYLVMPLIECGSLTRQLSEEKPMAEEECVAIARQVAFALAHAHAKGVIHRDLKPGNVLLDASGKAFLADFGLARTLFNDSLVDAEKGETGEGTPHYMSPQLARGEAEDTRCDIYALGALLYEMLTGRPPYEGQSTAQILQKIRNAPPEPILKLRPKLSPRLVMVMEGAMARAHRDRYANMLDVLADLERLEAGQSPAGPHTSFSLRRFFHGRSRQMAGVACGLVALLFAGVGYTWFHTESSLRVLREVSLPQVVSWAGAQTGDWDGDGEADLLQVSDDKLYVFSGRGQQHRPMALEKPHASSLWLGMAADVDGDGMDEAFVSWNSGTNACLTAFNQRAWPIREFVFGGSLNVHPQLGTNYTRLLPLRLADLDGDGKRELLAAVASSWALRPRGVCCFDVETGQLKWFYETATFVMDIELCDLDGDGRREVVVGSNSPGNGCSLADGTDDTHAYLYALSSHGEFMWRHELGGVFVSIRPLHREPTNRTVLAWVTAGHAYSVRKGEPDTGKILEFDARGTLVRSHDFGVQLTGALMVDIDGSGQREVLAGDRLGNLHVLDPNLRERRSITIEKPRFDEVDVQLFGTGQVDQSGVPHLILASSQIERRSEPAPGNSRKVFETIFYHDNRVIALDSHLKQVATHLVAEKWTENPGIKVQLLAGKGAKAPEILVLADKAQFLGLMRTQRALFGRSDGVQKQ